MFNIKVQHRDERCQVMTETFKRKFQAEKFIKQQMEIARTNGHKVGQVENEFIVFTNHGDGTRQTTMWITRAR